MGDAEVGRWLDGSDARPLVLQFGEYHHAFHEDAEPGDLAAQLGTNSFEFLEEVIGEKPRTPLGRSGLVLCGGNTLSCHAKHWPWQSTAFSTNSWERSVRRPGVHRFGALADGAPYRRDGEYQYG